MTEQDIQNLRNIAIEGMKKGYTREEAFQSLRDAGILDENNNYTEPYQNLGRAIEAAKKKRLRKNYLRKKFIRRKRTRKYRGS
ncbi:MAG TPA: hypothetical protein VNS58_27970 [Puia sp.]|nr:hypothetical protein [Puia sp.]